MKRFILVCMIVCVVSLTSLRAQVVPIVPPVTETGHSKPPATNLPTAIGPIGNALITGNGIDYHGGPVMLTPHNIYFIWYGNWTSNTALSILPQFISGLNGSSYFNTNTLYANGSGQNIVNTVTMSTQVFDNYSQGTVLSDAGLRAVISNQLFAGALPTDRNGIYFVLTSQDVDQIGSLGEFCVQFCGFHNHATLNRADIKYSFVGNIARCPSACSASNLGIGPNGNAGADAMANVMAHELNETVTDPDLNAWFDSAGLEVGDKCNFRFGPEYTTANGAPANVPLGSRNFLIQENWINSAGGFCGMSFGSSLTVGSLPSSSTQLSSFLDPTGVTTGAPAGQSAFYRATDQHVHHLYSNSNTVWHTDDPTGMTGAPPAVSGTAISSFLDPTGVTTGAPAGQSIFYIAADQHVHHVYSNTTWHTDDPTAMTGATLAIAGSPVTSFLDSTGALGGGIPGQAIFYIGTDQHVHHLFTDTTWHTDDPTAGAGAPLAATGSSLCSFLDPTGALSGGIPGQAIFYIGTDQHVHHLFSDTTWHTDDPTAGAGAPLAAVGSPLSCFIDPTGALTGGIHGQAIFYLGTDQHVHHLFSDTTWHADDPTAGAGAPLAAPGSSLSSFLDATGALTGGIHGQAIFYIGTDQHVHHLFSDTTWHTDDPTAGAGAPAALAGSPLSSFLDATGVLTGGFHGQAIFYIGVDQHVHHLFSDTTWHADDPTSLTGAPLSSL